MTTRRQHLAFWVQRLRIRLATWLVRKYDGVVVSRIVYHQGLEYLADISGDIERSGALRHRPRVFKHLERKMGQTTQAFVDALRLGDASISLVEARDVYVNARARALPRKKMKEMAQLEALRVLSAKYGKSKEGAA